MWISPHHAMGWGPGLKKMEMELSSCGTAFNLSMWEAEAEADSGAVHSEIPPQKKKKKKGSKDTQTTAQSQPVPDSGLSPFTVNRSLIRKGHPLSPSCFIFNWKGRTRQLRGLTFAAVQLRSAGVYLQLKPKLGTGCPRLAESGKGDSSLA